jgi:hypothetical protein
MIHYRKIGGLHWLFLGRIRIAFCLVRKPTTTNPRRLMIDVFPLA